MLLLLGLFVFDASPCWACSCVPNTKRGYADASHVIFTGKVLEVRGGFGFNERTANRILSRDYLPFYGEAVFRVKTVYKGYVQRTHVIAGAGGEESCGFAFEPGKTYTVFADHRNGHLETGLCQGTVEKTIDPSEYGLSLETAEMGLPRAKVYGGFNDNQPSGYARWFLLVFAVTAAVTAVVIVRFLWIPMRKLVGRFSR